jgi:hypothetical protein
VSQSPQFNLCINLEGTYISTCIALGVDKPIENRSVVSVFPNPSNGSFQVAMGYFEGEKTQVNVFDVEGRVVLQRTF